MASPIKRAQAVYGRRSKQHEEPSAPFQFDFRHHLKELDEQFDDRDSHSSGSPAAGCSQVKDLQSVSMGTPSQARRSSGDPARASLSPLPTQHTPQSSVRRRAPRTLLSESDTEEPSKSSSASPVRHPITTPHSRSSPTPPTSGEIQMVSRKTKGKAPARDVLPLVFDSEPPSAAEFPIKAKKGRQSEPLARPRTKAPTRKERREAALESSRIAANRPVEVIRTQEQKYTLSAFFDKFRRDNIVMPALGAELPSDPIEKFSSPTDRPTHLPSANSIFGPPSGLLRSSEHAETSHRLSSSESTKVLPPAADDSDDEMPSVTSLIRRAGGKQQRLQEIKRVALQHADIDSEDDEDDLLVVKDDMHAVAREEVVHRRLDKAHGSPTKDIAMLRKINHPSIRPVVISPRKPMERQLQEHAKPSFARREKGFKGQLTKRQLDQYMITRHTEEQLKSINRYEEEWVKGGGKLLRQTGGGDTQTSLSQKLESYAEQGLKAVDGPVSDGASTDESDEDYAPDLQGSASPEPMDADEHDSEPSNGMEILQVPLSQVDDEDEVAPLRRSKAGRRHPRAVMGSDDEGEEISHANPPSVRRDSASSMESQTEDENDKENSAKLMYDRSDDKENKAVVRHELSASDIPLVSRIGSTEDDVGENPSPTSVADAPGLPKGDGRSPLKDISKDDDDLFLSSPSVNPSFTERLLDSTVISPPRPSASTYSLGSPPALRGERIGRINRLSFGSEIDENDPSGLKLIQPSFLEKLHSQISPGPSLPSINPLPIGGFSQLFSAEERSLPKSAKGAEKDDLSLTLDVGLKPALEVSGTLKQKAETIFEKEQEYVVAAVQQNDGQKELLYVNDHGFLTQTCPEGSSPQVYRMTPSQASGLIATQPHSTQLHLLSARPPLRTLSFTVSQDPSAEPQPLKRLRKRSPSPLEQKVLGQSCKVAQLNAFDILGKTAKPPQKAQKHEKSEFVAVEAEESDEDDMFGFGGPKKDDGDDEEEDNGEDKVVEGLVDDAAMDAETEAADLVLEKHREHEEEDDQQLQKLHQDAIEGKFRIKRRYGGVGLEDDSDEDDDDDARRIRQRIHKKRKIEGDSLEALGENEETRAFYDTYHQDLIDADDEFGHLREDAVRANDDDDAAPEQLEQDTVSVDEIRQRVREMAQSHTEVEMLDFEDTSWIDKSMVTEADDTVHVKVVEYRPSKPSGRHTNAGQMDFDTVRRGQHAENEQERKQMVAWARHQNHQRQGTGRSGNSAAVTGHSKAKAGGGSLRSTQSRNAPIAGETRKVKTSSLLSSVSNRRGKFVCG